MGLKAGGPPVCITPPPGHRFRSSGLRARVPLGPHAPPPHGHRFSSWGRRTGVAVGTHAPLLAQALVLDDGERTVAIVAVDLGNVAREFTDDVRKRVQALPGIPPDAILINASHTHSGPPGIPRRSGISLGGDTPGYDGYAA